ncbi:hypothetical protein PRVXH_000485 [Proteinivorax hydrogeniformans]|uniref:Uncharacterized protein n=1 Tax=Proteinivorax hydrogeniformans TaxID=1826727 RepID=A0AAU8HUW7_9FIRM
MQEGQLEKIVTELSALQPQYLKGTGKVTKVHLKSGKHLTIKCKPETVVTNIAGYLGTDLAALRKFCSHRLAAKNSLPLPMTPSLLLIPLRMIKPKFSNDRATGYVNLFSIEDLKEKKNGAIITLVGGNEVLCRQKLKTVKIHLVYARLIYREWQSHYINPYVKEADNNLYNTAKLDLIRKIMNS